MAFPKMAQILDVHALDLFKVIGPFVRAERSMPRIMKRHLLGVDELILESLGWQSKSWLSLLNTCPHTLDRCPANRCTEKRNSNETLILKSANEAGSQGAMHKAGLMDEQIPLTNSRQVDGHSGADLGPNYPALKRCECAVMNKA